MTLSRPITARLVADIPALPRARLEFETAREVDRLDPDDCARPGLAWIQVAARRGPPVTVVVATDDGGQAASPADTLARLCGGRPKCQWTTRAGGSVRWIGPAVRPRDHAGGLSATATNDLRVVDVDGRPAVLKVYRVLESDRDESTLLAALRGTFTPRPLARVSYRPPAGGPATCLALITERVPGQTLDEPLLESLQHRWRSGRSALDRPTLTTLTRVRSALGAFHAALEHACTPYVRSDLGRAAHVRRDALRAGVRALLNDEQERAGPAGPARAGARLVLAAAAAAAARTTWLDVAPAHGDLHLAHVLVDGERVRFVDMARPEPHSSQADDGAALRRAVECMALDMVVTRAAAERSRPAIEVVDELVTRALRAASGDLLRPIDLFGPLAAVMPRELAATRAWTAQVCDLLDPAGSGTPHGLPYLSRLIHDLQHHSDRRDRYHAGLAWCHLVQACSAAAPQTLGGQRHEGARCMS